MSDESRLTRRTVIRSGAAAASASALAGCLSEVDDGGSSSDGDGGNTGGDGSGGRGGSGDGSYTVSMPPVGDVEFDAVPETWAANNGSWADMGIALGQEPPTAVYLASRYHTRYYDEIPGVSVDTSEMISLWEGELDPEEFMGLAEDVDVFVNDPNFIIGRTDHWSRDDVDRIELTGTPFFANSIFSRGYDWHDYDYFTLYEAFEKLAQVFQETERYEAFASLHEEFLSAVAEIVPAEGERPSVAIMWGTEANLGEFSPYLVDEGTSFKQWRDLGVVDAFAETDVRDFHSSRGAVGYETLLDIDPDVLLFRGNEAKTADEFQDTIVAALESDNTARKLTAVQNGDVYRGGPLYQGPITNLVVTERAARQVYGVDEALFDRQRVADIVAGEIVE